MDPVETAPVTVAGVGGCTPPPATPETPKENES